MKTYLESLVYPGMNRALSSSSVHGMLVSAWIYFSLDPHLAMLLSHHKGNAHKPKQTFIFIKF